MNSWGNEKKVGELFEILKVEWPAGRSGELSTIRNIVTHQVVDCASPLLCAISTEDTRQILTDLRDKKTAELNNITATLIQFEEKYGY